jgi:hypothetical protein
MADKSSKGSTPSTAPEADALPPAVIAQAEAAIAANTPADAPTFRRPSYSQHQDTLHKSTSRGQTGSSSAALVFFIRSNHDITNECRRSSKLQGSLLGVPDLMGPDGTSVAPPAYDQKTGQMQISQDGFDTQAKVTGMS